MPSSFQITNEAFRLKLSFHHGEVPALRHLCCARRDNAAFQIIVQSDLQYSLNIRTGEWFSAKGCLAGPHERLRIAVDAPFPVRMNLEEFVTDDDDIKKADILLNQDVRESPADTPTAVWVEADVPEDARPAEYRITVCLYASLPFQDETLISREQITLTVMDVLMPAPEEWKFKLDLWQHTSNIARKHDVELWSDAHFAVLSRYLSSLAALGQKSVTIVASEIPWLGQNCYANWEYNGNLYEYAMIRIVRKKDGQFVYDYSAMKRYIDLAAENGITGDIEVFGIANVWQWTDTQLKGSKPCDDYAEAIRLRYLDEADGCMKYIRDRETICDFVRALEEYFVSTNLIDRVHIAADEPDDVEKFRNSLALLHEIAPRFHYKTAINHAEFIKEFHDKIDVFVPYLQCAITERERLLRFRTIYPQKTVQWYVCCGGASPNTYLRTPPIECRMIGILTSILRFDGFLRWSYTVWPDDPRRELRYGAFEAGDTSFVYPAHNGDVLLSLRYKNLRRGIADYELIERLRAGSGDDAVHKAIKKVLQTDNLRDFWHGEALLPSEALFSLNWEDYDDMRASVLVRLSCP